MQRFAVIGLGRFGTRLAGNLTAAGREVMAIDRDPQVIQSIRDKVTLAVAMDATDESAMKAQGLDQVDVAVVSIGQDFEATALATVLLKQMNVKQVISRAVTPVGSRILSMIGADNVINPEDESADRWSVRLVSPHLINHFELDAGHSIVEVAMPSQWVGQNLLQLDLRNKMRIHVVALKRKVAGAGAIKHGSSVSIPFPTEPFRKDDALLLMGADEDLANVPTPRQAKSGESENASS